MKIVDIFKDKELMDEFFENAAKDRMVSNVNAYAGVNAENNLCLKFNSKNDHYKLYNEKILIDVVYPSDCSVNWNGFCKNTEDLKQKIKQTQGSLSASDLFLFKVDGLRRTLIDFASLKTSIAKSSDRLVIHNDSDGDIHDDLISQKNRTIGKIILAIYRSGSYKVYHYQNNFQDFNKVFTTGDWMVTDRVTKESRRNGLTLNLKEQPVLKAFDRKIISKGKQTSFNRGFFIIVDKDDPFKNPQTLVNEKLLEEINSGSIDETSFTRSLFNQFSC